MRYIQRMGKMCFGCFWSSKRLQMRLIDMLCEHVADVRRAWSRREIVKSGGEFLCR